MCRAAADPVKELNLHKNRSKFTTAPQESTSHTLANFEALETAILKLH